MAEETIHQKPCSKCRAIKPLDAFPKAARMRLGRDSTCRECRKIKCREWWHRTHPTKPAEDLPDEIWKPVPDYEGLYSISNMGRVRREAGGKRTFRGRILKPLLRMGYLRVFLYRLGEKGSKKLTIHCLVADVFLSKQSHHEEVNHKNGVKTDNRAENLEWVTHAENMAHARDVLKVMSNKRRAA